MRTIATVMDPMEVLDLVRDPDDNRVIEAAVAGRADYIVSGDRTCWTSASTTAFASRCQPHSSRCSRGNYGAPSQRR